jgi:hypothetical protein
MPFSIFLYRSTAEQVAANPGSVISVSPTPIIIWRTSVSVPSLSQCKMVQLFVTIMATTDNPDSTVVYAVCDAVAIGL